ncbi:MAG: glycerophosphodiester phosphodiesterase [Oscillospiraceae bacterium]|nr:glycerophosphodiester phosphodiesterase [Oscillospiraceae bacterium]
MMEIWAHRGAYDYAPENTLTAFLLAIDKNADGVELDIQMTRDGEVVVIHDETVDRTSTGSGNVGDFTLSEIKKLNFNKRGVTPPAFMEIPTLAEFFELMKPSQLKINVEFKTNVVFYEGIEARALEIARRHDIVERVVWSSSNHYTIANLKRLEPNAETAYICSGQIFVTGEQCEKTGVSALHPNYNQLRYPGFVDECHSRGVKVRPWTVNSYDGLKFVHSLGVDGVFTNDIDKAKEFLQGS